MYGSRNFRGKKKKTTVTFEDFFSAIEKVFNKYLTRKFEKRILFSNLKYIILNWIFKNFILNKTIKLSLFIFALIMIKITMHHSDFCRYYLSNEQFKNLILKYLNNVRIFLNF